MPRSGFARAVALIMLAALALRLLDALLLAPSLSFLDDDTFYHRAALDLADGHGYVQRVGELPDAVRPTAEHPPLYPVLLSAVARLGARSIDAQRGLGILSGTLTVGLVALIGRELAGSRAGLTAAGLTAVYPSFVAADGALMSETLFALLLAAALLQTLRTLEVPTVRRGAVVGLLLGLAILTRAEAVLLLLLLTALVLARAPARRGVVAGSTIVVSLLIAAPWVARNWDLFGQPVLANDDGTTVAASNCRATYYGRDVGGAAFSCLVRAAGLTGPTTNEAVRAARLRRVGWRYARRHAGRAIVVAAVRVARVWGVWRPSTQFRLTGRRPGVQKLGVGMFYLLIPLAFLGGWVLRDRRSALAVLLAPMLSLTVAAAVTTANVRLRTGGELSLLVLAGVGLSSHRLLRPRSARGYTQVC